VERQQTLLERPQELLERQQNLVTWQQGAFGPLIVLGNCGIGDLIALRETLAWGPVDVTAAHAGERLAAQALKPLRAALREGMRRFHLWVRSEFAGTKWERLLVHIPPLLAGIDRFRPPVRSTLVHWELLEEARPDVPFPQIRGMPPYSRAHFAEEFEQFEAALDAHTDAKSDLLLARVEWQMLEERAVAVMKAYGHAVKARLGDGARLTASLPQLWPGPRRGSRRKR
jgi:hypothetical protein